MPNRALRLLPALLVILAAIAWLFLGRLVHGSVRDAETGSPLAGASIAAGARRVQADGEGRFAVDGLSALTLLHVAAPGYQPARALLLPAGLFSLQPGVTVRLRPTMLSGTVRDPDTHSPVAGALVRAGAQHAQTDAKGHYTLKRLLPGDQVVAQAPDHRSSEAVAYAGQVTLDLPLTLLPVTVQVQNYYSGAPMAGVTVTAGEQTAQSDAAGRATLAWPQPGVEVKATLPGYAEATAPAGAGDTVTLRLRPNTLRGAVRDEEGHPLANALVLLRAPGGEAIVTHTDEQGAYAVENVPADASLTIRKAGFKRVLLKPGPETAMDFQLEPFVAKGLYIPFGLLTQGVESKVQENLDLVSRTEMNAVVIDVKGDRSWLAFEPEHPLAREIDATYDGIADLRQVLAECKQRGIYTIARMVIFKDDILATARPEWAVRRGDGSLWKDNEGLAWTDPFRREVWEYNVALAKEVVALGFDEIQFDYLRFPSDGDIYDMEFSQESNTASRCQAISGFVAYAREELDKTGAFLSADLFGMVTSVDPNQHLGDLGIGQRLIDVAPWVDYISPMVYPSMYEPGHLGLSDPWRQPYEVVRISVQDAHKQTSTLIRPWLQGYSLYGVSYGPREHRLQIQAAVDAKATGWLIWNAGGVYEPAAFAPQ